MVVTVHGGPSSATMPTFVWEGTRADLANEGYYQFFPNPRGSYGQGEAFTRANIRDFGGGDLRDILAGVDAVEKLSGAPIDDNRLGLTGGSYGGFMSMWANTQTNRFKAIVAGAGLSDWISYYGTNGIDEWMIPFFGKSMYDDPGALLGGVGDPDDQAGAHPDLHLRRRARHRGPAHAVDRILACSQGNECADEPRHLSRRGPSRARAGTCPRYPPPDRGLVQSLSGQTGDQHQIGAWPPLRFEPSLSYRAVPVPNARRG